MSNQKKRKAAHRQRGPTGISRIVYERVMPVVPGGHHITQVIEKTTYENKNRKLDEKVDFTSRRCEPYKLFQTALRTLFGKQ